MLDPTEPTLTALISGYRLGCGIQPFKQVGGCFWLWNAGFGAAVGAIVVFEFGLFIQFVEVDLVLNLGDLVTYVLLGGFTAKAADFELLAIKFQFDGLARRWHLDKRQQCEKRGFD